MKTRWTAGLLVCAGAAAVNAQPLGSGRLPTDLTNAAPLDAPSPMPGDPSGSQRLRDVLRQPLNTPPAANSPPYRLSPDERHRLREQLRSQPNTESGKNK